MISSRISEDQKAGLAERGLKLISESSGSMATRNRMSSSVLGEFEDCSLTVGSCRLNNNILWILNSNDNSRSKLKFLPGFAQVNDEDTYEKSEIPLSQIMTF